MPKGNGEIMYGMTGQKDLRQNIYTGVPLSKENSFASIAVKQGETKAIDVKASECYGCWYFIRVQAQSPTQVVYRLTVSRG